MHDKRDELGQPSERQILLALAFVAIIAILYSPSSAGLVLVAAGVLALLALRGLARTGRDGAAAGKDVDAEEDSIAPTAFAAAVQRKPIREWDSVMSSYSLRKDFFNRSERSFYWALTRAVSERYFIFPKVRLLDICSIPQTGEYNAMNRVSAKHVDFLLCERSSLVPVAAIEVDGSSHRRPDRVQRDEFVDDLFEQIGLPLIHVPAATWFEPADVLRRIEAATARS